MSSRNVDVISHASAYSKSLNMRVYYAAKAGMAIALSEHLADLQLGDPALRILLAQVTHYYK